MRLRSLAAVARSDRNVAPEPAPRPRGQPDLSGPDVCKTLG